VNGVRVLQSAERSNLFRSVLGKGRHLKCEPFLGRGGRRERKKREGGGPESINQTSGWKGGSRNNKKLYEGKREIPLCKRRSPEGGVIAKRRKEVRPLKSGEGGRVQ